MNNTVPVAKIIRATRNAAGNIRWCTKTVQCTKIYKIICQQFLKTGLTSTSSTTRVKNFLVTFTFTIVNSSILTVT